MTFTGLETTTVTDYISWIDVILNDDQSAEMLFALEDIDNNL